MFCDVFSKKQALKLLEGKKVWFIGSSNMRAIYKDVLWLITHEELASENAFKIKNEPSYLRDTLTTNDTVHNGRNYRESRVFQSDKINLMFHFITRLYLDHFIDLINKTTSDDFPDVLLINSCLWDLTRWGPDGPKNFKGNILRTMKFLQAKLPARTKVIWKTTLPVSTSADGAIFVDEIKFIVPMLPWHILEANNFASTCASFFNFDVIDFHHHMRMQGHLRVKDGIHWKPLAIRYLTNLFLTHLSLSWSRPLPGRFKPSQRYLQATTKVTLQEQNLRNRLKKKEGFFRKLFANPELIKAGSNLQGIKNKVLVVSRNIFKPKKRHWQQKLKKAATNKYKYRQSNFCSSSNHFSSNINNRTFNYINNVSNNRVNYANDVMVNNLNDKRFNNFNRNNCVGNNKNTVVNNAYNTLVNQVVNTVTYTGPNNGNSFPKNRVQGPYNYHKYQYNYYRQS